MLSKLEKFWANESADVAFFSRNNKIFIGDIYRPHWFPGWTLNASYCLLDKFIEKGFADKKILFFENERSKAESYTYEELLNVTCQIAQTIKKHGVKKGDIAAIYMPTIPQALCTMLACARLGITFTFIFSAFSKSSLRERLIESKAKILIGTNTSFYGGKKISLLDNIKFAVKDLPVKTLLINRSPHKEVLGDIIRFGPNKQKKTYIPAIRVESNHPLFFLFTSGTTGKPKKVTHSTGGYLVQAIYTFKKILKPTSGMYWCSADLGWITGHTYVAFAPLATNTKFLMYEGAINHLNYRIWPKLINRYKVESFFSAPTAWRILKSEISQKLNLNSIKLVGSVGEKLSAGTWKYIHEKFANHPKIKDVWWQTETGSIMLYPRKNLPGSVGRPIFGLKACLDKGQLVFENSWPSQMIRPSKKYFQNDCFLSGDLAVKIQGGNYLMKGRADDVVNVSGHRISLLEIEEVVRRLTYVRECAAIAIDDEITGKGILVR